MEENHTAVVFDANVIIASLIRSGGLNRLVAILAPLIYPCFQPEALKDEILKHEKSIAGKSKMTIDEVRRGLKEILEPINTVPDQKVKAYSSEASSLVNDPDDAAYIATALYLRRGAGYRQVVIITWNKKDYDTDALPNLGIQVLNPKEFYDTYLRHPMNH